jgi:acid-sensing ion channel, other
VNNAGLKFQIADKKFISCNEPGFLVHSPYELPTLFLKESFSNFMKRKAQEVLITPEVVGADESLKDLSPQERRCYFDGEKKLKYFRIYTQRNCEAECASEIIYSKCGCVPFYYVRNDSMEICNSKLWQCETYYATNEDFKKQLKCDCLSACNSITYFYEIVPMKFSDTTK